MSRNNSNGYMSNRDLGRQLYRWASPLSSETREHYGFLEDALGRFGEVHVAAYFARHKRSLEGLEIPGFREGDLEDLVILLNQVVPKVTIENPVISSVLACKKPHPTRISGIGKGARARHGNPSGGHGSNNS